MPARTARFLMPDTSAGNSIFFCETEKLPERTFRNGDSANRAEADKKNLQAGYVKKDDNFG